MQAAISTDQINIEHTYLSLTKPVLSLPKWDGSDNVGGKHAIREANARKI